MATKTSARRSTGARKGARKGATRKTATRKSAARKSAARTGATRKTTARKTTARKGAARKGAAGGPRTATGKPTPERPSKGISRIDQPSRRTHGFFVRLDYRKTPDGYRPRLVAFFGDASHGGKRAAWRAAEEWADRMRRTSARGGAAKRK